jgi:hypothetical protein
MHFSEDPEYYGQLVSHLVETSMSNSRASRLSELDQGSGGDEETAGPAPQQARRSLFGLRRGGLEEKEEEETTQKKKKKKKKKKKEKKQRQKREWKLKLKRGNRRKGITRRLKSKAWL